MNKRIEDKLERFLIRIRPQTLAFATFRVNDENVALDLLQETMIGFVNIAHTYEEKAWKNLFYKILVRRMVDKQRKNTARCKRYPTLPFSHLSESEEIVSNYLGEDSQANSVESQASAYELFERFKTLVESLPPSQQEIYLLRQWQGFSIKETAFIVQRSEASVKTHFFRAMQALKEALGEWLDET